MFPTYRLLGLLVLWRAFHLVVWRVAISSESGMQQGFPLGPVPFACAAHQTALQL